MRKISDAIFFRIISFLQKFGIGGGKIMGINVLYRIANLTINGQNNYIDVKSRLPKGVKVVMYGNNHRLIIDKGVTFKNGTIWFENEGNKIHIKRGTTIESANLSVAEKRTSLIIGENCMLSSGIRISTTDSHSIIDLESGNRTNPAADVIIGCHCWIGYNSSINKGVSIGPNSVVASNSVVTKSVESNTIVAGIPAKVVTKGITWDRKRI